MLNVQVKKAKRKKRRLAHALATARTERRKGSYIKVLQLVNK